MEMENLYVAPSVDIIEVRVEKGFYASADDPNIGGGDVNLPGGREF